MSIIKKSTAKELIAARFVTLGGELYRIPVAMKTTTTVITNDKPEKADDDGTVIMEGQESIKGVPYTFYTVTYVKIEKSKKIKKIKESVKTPNTELVTYQNKTIVYEPMFFIPISGEPKAVAKTPIPSLILEVTGYYDKVKGKDLINLKVTETDNVNWQSARVVDSTKQIKTYTL